MKKTKSKEESIRNKQLIVGIGASAGGLEALQQLLKAMSTTTDASFVIVQHLSPDYKSLLAEILGKCTTMSVKQAENDTVVEPNSVYLIPPKNNMILEDGRLYLKEYSHGGLNHPIDIFLTSLAEAQKEACVGIVLSGTGSDGTSGIKAIKESGGLVIIQDPVSAKFDGMPRSAIGTGFADFILPPEKIAEEIATFAKSQALINLNPETTEPFTDSEILNHIYEILKHIYKIDYTHYKQTTVIRRLERRMAVMHKHNYQDYVSLLENSPEEAKTLGREILIGVTSFFRDPAYFDTLKNQVLKPLIISHNAETPLRIWSVGCSTGEEAYSLAIICCEIIEELNLKCGVKIFASDVDAESIERAGKGVFAESVIDDVSPDRLAKYFTKKGDTYLISKDIRKMIIFAQHNVFQDPPFGKLDLISCRNVLIYFQPVLQKTLFAIFHAALNPDGYLFLGKSETTGNFSSVFPPLIPSERIYKHNAAAKGPETVTILYTTPKITEKSINQEVTGLQDAPKEEIESYFSFLEEFITPGVIINEKNELVHTFGSTDSYLHSPKGNVSTSIFDFINEDLSLIFSTALNKIKDGKSNVSYTDVKLSMKDGTKKAVDIIMRPVTTRFGTSTGRIAILFVDRKQIIHLENAEQYDVNATAAQRILDLENELQTSQSNLRASITEQETVNEELQAANEELLTANEELQSSNEELQSVNEELYTVNAEYQEKLDELTDLNNDMSNFLSSTMIGIVFVDQKLNIRKFTDYIGREFGLMEQDIGRPIQILSHYFDGTDLAQDAAKVVKTLLPDEREMQSTSGKVYSMRISPYRTIDNTIKGVVITIIDSLIPKN